MRFVHNEVAVLDDRVRRHELSVHSDATRLDRESLRTHTREWSLDMSGLSMSTMTRSCTQTYVVLGCVGAKLG